MSSSTSFLLSAVGITIAPLFFPASSSVPISPVSLRRTGGFTTLSTGFTPRLTVFSPTTLPTTFSSPLSSFSDFAVVVEPTSVETTAFGSLGVILVISVPISPVSLIIGLIGLIGVVITGATPTNLPLSYFSLASLSTFFTAGAIIVVSSFTPPTSRSSEYIGSNPFSLLRVFKKFLSTLLSASP